MGVLEFAAAFLPPAMLGWAASIVHRMRAQVPVPTKPWTVDVVWNALGGCKIIGCQRSAC